VAAARAGIIDPGAPCNRHIFTSIALCTPHAPHAPAADGDDCVRVRR
jgi:hypothetical protein